LLMEHTGPRAPMYDVAALMLQCSKSVDGQRTAVFVN